MKRFIAVDPGAGGGVAHYVYGKKESCHAIPEISIFDSFIREQKEVAEKEGSEFIVVIEHQQIFMLDSMDGRQFRMRRLLDNFAQLKSTCDNAGVRFFTILPRVWQKHLGLTTKRTMSKTDRKNKYKQAALDYYPHLKPTLKTADALCMLQFLAQKLKFDPRYVELQLKK